MPLELHPMTEADFPSLVQIQQTAFNTGMTLLLTPRPITAQDTQKSIEKHLKSFSTEPDITYLKVVDTSLRNSDGTPKMIAAAKWRINEEERTEEQIQGMLPVPGEDEMGEERRGLRDFMGYLCRVRREYMGTRPFAFLHMLITDPEHQRRGAGAMLVDWGVEKADKAGIPSFLEASEAGRPLYERKGFVAQAVETFDLTKYGLEGQDTNTAMLRAARGV